MEKREPTEKELLIVNLVQKWKALAMLEQLLSYLEIDKDPICKPIFAEISQIARENEIVDEVNKLYQIAK